MRTRAILILILHVQLADAIIVSRDSTRVKKNWFYLLSSYNVGVGAAKSNYFAKYSESEKVYYDFERHEFDFKTPSLGLGFFHQAKRSLFKIDISYLYTLKKINRVYTGSSRDIHDYVRSDYLDPRAVIYSAEDYPVGGSFYEWSDNVNVNLNAHYLDIDCVAGRKISGALSFIAGFRIDKLLNYSYKGTIERNAEIKQITGFYQQPGYLKDTLISEKTIVIDDKNELENKMSQAIGSNFYWIFGINYKFLTNGNLFLLDLMYDLNAPLKSYKRRDYICLKISWCIKG